MNSRCLIRRDLVWKTKGNIFKSDHLFVTFLLKITFQSVVSKKSQDEIKNFLSYPICLVLLFRPSSRRVEIRLRSKIESTVYGIGYSWARYCMWIIQDWKHKKLNTSANCHPTNEINQRLETIISRKIRDKFFFVWCNISWQRKGNLEKWCLKAKLKSNIFISNRTQSQISVTENRLILMQQWQSEIITNLRWSISEMKFRIIFTICRQNDKK